MGRWKFVFVLTAIFILGIGVAQESSLKLSDNIGLKKIQKEEAKKKVNSGQGLEKEKKGLEKEGNKNEEVLKEGGSPKEELKEQPQKGNEELPRENLNKKNEESLKKLNKNDSKRDARYINLDDIVEFEKKEGSRLNSSFQKGGGAFENKSSNKSLIKKEDKGPLIISKNSSLKVLKKSGARDFLNNLTSKNKTEENLEINKSKNLDEKRKENKSKEKEIIKKSIFKDGKIEIEYKIEEGEDIEIVKKEIVKEKNVKEVIVHSDEHFNREVRIYSDLPVESKKKEILIKWENKNALVLSGVEYYDENNNGLIDRVSWAAPHLSTQRYKIIINPKEGGNSSKKIEIGVISPLNGSRVSNPVEFNLSLNYTNKENLACSLKIGAVGYVFNFSKEIFNKVELNEGNHTFSVYCEDSLNKSINEEVFGYFTVEDRFNLELLSQVKLTGSSVGGRVDSNGGIVEIRIRNPLGVESFWKNVSGIFPLNFEIEKTKFGAYGNYSIVAISHFFDEPSRIEKNISLFEGSVDFNSEAERGSKEEFEVVVKSPVSGSYELFLDNARIGKGNFNSGEFSTKINKKIEKEGEYPVSLEVTIKGEKFVLPQGKVVVKSGKDEEDPEVELKSPDWGDVLPTKDITFTYSAKDNVMISNCSLQVYNATKGDSGVYKTDTLIFPLNSNDKNYALKNNPENNEEISVKVFNFDDGDYIWEVNCYDNSSNKGWNFNYFKVNTGQNQSSNSSLGDKGENYTRSSEVKDLIKKINSFLEKEKNFSLSEREVLDALKISKDMNFFKKRMIQIDQDLRFNLKILGPEKKKKRTEELYKEIDDIKGKIVLDVEVLDNYEFSKNSLETPISEVLQKYLESKNIQMSSADKKALINANEEIQKNLRTRVKTRKVRVHYLNRTENLVIVEKIFNLTGGGVKKIFEVVPNAIGEDAVFVLGGEHLGDGLYEIDLDKLNDGRVVYYFEGDVDLKELEKTESVLFSEDVKGSSYGVTGMFLAVGDGIFSGYSFFFAFLVACIGYLGFYAYGKIKIEKWKENPNVSILLDLIAESKEHLRKGEVDLAKEKYREMNKIYPKIPRKCKNYFYRELERICFIINKKEVFRLVREYELAKEQFRKEDALALHKKIAEIYKKLPKKYREKVYQRIVKKEI